ncbi:MAG: twin-arginine translocase subunit TatC [bacterium]|nr:twin-arginine translocase subunit TatC [bacterium]
MVPDTKHSTDVPKTFGEHILEVRSRLLSSTLFLLVGSIIGYYFNQEIFEVLIKPLNQPVFYSSPSGGFDFVFKTSLLFGFLFSLPVFTYNLIRFLEPLFSERSVAVLLSMFLFSCLLLSTGIAFGYFVSLPAALYFLNAFATDNVQALISADEYFSFVARYLLGFGLLFQLPLFLIAINEVHPLTARQLLSYEKWIIVLSFVVAAILTPTPDLLNQTVMAIPIIILYQVSVIAIWLANRTSA